MALCMYIQQHHKDGPLFITHTVAATTAYKDIYPTFFALESQSPEQLATSFWQDFDKAGFKVLRERPMMVTADGRGMVLHPTFFIERISVGALFHVAKSKPRNESLRIFSAFGDAFEEYVAHTLRGQVSSINSSSAPTDVMRKVGRSRLMPRSSGSPRL